MTGCNWSSSSVADSVMQHSHLPFVQIVIRLAMPLENRRCPYEEEFNVVGREAKTGLSVLK